MSPNEIVRPIHTGTAAADGALRERFTRLWQRCLAPGTRTDARTVWSILETRYGEPHRRYHDMRHLGYCLEQLDLAAGQIRDADRVEMAIWFHDVINDPGQPDNEARSATFFRKLAHGVMDPDFAVGVADLIGATTHDAPPTDQDQRFICDIDLASFGCPWECFMEDSANVKAEFHGPDEEYYRGKRAFLEAMLARPRIFLTDFFYDRYERQARENIARLLDWMAQRQDR